MLDWKEILLASLVGPLELVGAATLSQAFDKIKPVEKRKLILSTLYPVVDIELEEMTKKSKTKFDDPFTSALKKAIEASAANCGLSLQNLDTD